MSIELIKEEMFAYGEKIGLESSSAQYPHICTRTAVHSDGKYIYADDAYYYVCTERGKTVKQYRTGNLEELFYYVFDDITFNVALEYEMKHRKDGEDFRRQMFSKQLELLEKINPRYRERQEREIAQILQENPYVD